jgi:antitoxin component YwqK of YwqJK toxin-antitoxin module
MALVFEGAYKDYDRDDHLIAEGVYTKGRKTGVHKSYFADGTIKTIIKYEESGFVVEALFSDEHKALVKNGTGKFSLPVSYKTIDLQNHWKNRSTKKLCGSCRCWIKNGFPQ